MPTSWAAVYRRMSTLPVSGSTSTSTMCVVKEGPAPLGATEAATDMGPPVSINLPAISLNVSLSSFSALEKKTPSSNSTFSGSVSHSRAARAFISSMAWLVTSYTAQPLRRVVLLPAVRPLYPMESVSLMLGWTSSAAMPNASAHIIAMDVREPPMSGEPSARLTVPSLLMEMEQLAGIPALPQ